MKRLLATAAIAAALLVPPAPADAREYSAAIQPVETLVGQGKYDEARAVVLKVIADAERRRDDLLLAEAAGSYGGVLVGLGDMNGSGEWLKKAWDIRERVLGPNHPQTLFAINDYCVWLTIQGRLGLRRFAEVQVGDPQYAQDADVVGMVGPQHPFADGQGLLGRPSRVGVAAPAVVAVRQHDQAAEVGHLLAGRPGQHRDRRQHGLLGPVPPAEAEQHDGVADLHV
ncbi:MAG TPA: tetratricopeptide repeat protein, partial [bacterium]|nr:tetratricopeptide repeat protein [bacterium]